MEVKPGYRQTEAGVIPNDWEVAPLAREVVGLDAGVSVKSTDREPRPGQPAILKTSSVEDGKFIPSECKTIIPHDRQRATLCPRHNTLLISRMNTIDLVGECGYVENDYSDLFVPDRLWMTRLRTGSGLSVKWLSYVLSSRPYRRALREIATGTSGSMKNIAKDSLLAVPIVFPNDTEQHAIAEALSDVDALLDGLDRLIAKKRDLKQAAMQQLLTGRTRLPGFTGEWEVKRLEDVADIDPDNLESNTPPDYQFSYISLEDVDKGVLLSSSEQVFHSAPSRARRKLRKNDILVSTVRPNLQSHLLFVNSLPNWVCSTGFAVVRCREGATHPGYTFAHLFGHGIAQQFDTLLTGSNYPAVNSGDVRGLQIPFPKYDEQTAIAGVLTDMDAELIVLTKRREKTRMLKQAMVQELLTGRIRIVKGGNA